MPKFNLLGWFVCQFLKHDLVPGYFDSWPLHAWVPLHCSRCGMTFGKRGERMDEEDPIMTKKIAQAIASSYPFTFKEVLSLYDQKHSWDIVIAACNNSVYMGYGTLKTN